MSSNDSSNDPVWQAVRAKRAIRAFADRPLEPAHLERILEAGRRSRQLQEPAALVVHRLPRPRPPGPAGEVGPFAGHLAGAAAGDRPGHAGSAAPDAPLSILFDLGQAAAEHDAGRLGAGHRQRARHRLPASARQDLLGYPAGQHCEFLLSFGYPADPADSTGRPGAGGRRPADEIVHEERW